MSTDLVSPSAGTALAEIMRNPAQLKEFPIDVVERLYEMDKEMRAEAARREYIAAMHALQGELTPVRKRGRNTDNGSMYARLDDIERMLDPLISRYGFTYNASTERSDKQDCMVYVGTVRHVGGHETRHELEAPYDHLGPKGGPQKTRIHGMVSSNTYCKRTVKVNAFDVTVTLDDDGNAAGGIGPSAETITDNQVADLRALIEEAGANDEAFRKVCKVDKWEELPASMYKAAVQRLDMKRRA